LQKPELKSFLSRFSAEELNNLLLDDLETDREFVRLPGEASLQNKGETHSPEAFPEPGQPFSAGCIKGQ
jgi:hypothetical protein